MNHSPHPLPRHDSVTIPTIWFAVVLSLVIHALVLFVWPHVDPVTLEKKGDEPGQSNLTVQLQRERTPAPAGQKPPPAATAQATPPPARRGLPEKPSVAPPSPPRAVPFNRPTPLPAPAPTPAPSPPVARPSPPPQDGDLAAYIEARRRARGETEAPAAPRQELQLGIPPPQETEEERRQRIVAANLGLDRAPGFGGDSRSGGGIFQITRMGYSDAEFLFFGWNKDIKRNSRQRIEVTRGDAPDIRVAMIRRMIGIIREHEKGDFTWVSQRLGREVSLSARPGDQAGLEDFLMREFFPPNAR